MTTPKETRRCHECGAPVVVKQCLEGGDCARLPHSHPHFDARTALREALQARIAELTDEALGKALLGGGPEHCERQRAALLDLLAPTESRAT